MSARPGIFLMSLDCEGKWGMADRIDREIDEKLTTAALIGAYRQITQLFASFDVPATFAFVMALLCAPDELGEFDDLLQPDGCERDPWLKSYCAARRSSRLEGWHLPDALGIVQASGLHEIACHGFSHRPLGGSAISADVAADEFRAAGRVAQKKGVALRTLVFPRNEVAHLDVVRSSGFIGYRERLNSPGGSLGRIVHLSSEFNLWAAAQPQVAARNGLVPIPPGYFLNWRKGARRRVPPAVTRLRWRNLLRRAAAEGQVAHLWFHPHNLITGPGTAATLEAVLADVAEMRDRGELRVLTQEQYAEEMLAQARVAERVAS